MATIFTDGTTYAANKLQMINICLLAIGELPYPDGTLVSDIAVGTDGDVARRKVEETMIEVQNRGWYYNTDINYKLVPDSNGFISLSPNVLRIDVGNTPYRRRYILKDKRLYDRSEQTFKIDKQVMCDVIWLVDYEELPPAAFQYISLRAARKFQQSAVGSTELDGFTARDEQDALFNMQREHMQYSDYNFQSPRMNRNSNSGLIGGLYGSEAR